MRKFIFWGIILLFTLTGCESNGRVHNKNYLRAVAVNENNVTFNFFNDDEIITIDTNNLDFAKESAEICAGKKIFTGYTEIILINKPDSIATLEFMLKNWNISPSCLIAYSDNNIFENNIEDLTGSINMAIKQKKIPECDIITVMSNLLGREHSAEIAEISGNGVISIRKIN